MSKKIKQHFALRKKEEYPVKFCGYFFILFFSGHSPGQLAVGDPA